MDIPGPNGKFYLSPDFGLMLGTITRIEVSPSVGYNLTPRLSIGAGAKYQYYRIKDYYTGTYKTNIYGPQVFARLIIIKDLANIFPSNSNTQIFGHVEYESLSLENKYFNNVNITNGRFWFNTLLIGGGLSQAASSRINAVVLLLWDTDTSGQSPYSNPIFRIGINIKL